MSEATAMHQEPTPEAFPVLPARSGPGAVVRALGDSTAQGIGAASVDGGYIAQLHRQRPLPAGRLAVVNVSVSGARIDDVRRDQLPLLDALRPRVEPVADVHAAYRPPCRGKVAPDHFHPNTAGYADWTTAFLRALAW